MPLYTPLPSTPRLKWDEDGTAVLFNVNDDSWGGLAAVDSGRKQTINGELDNGNITPFSGFSVFQFYNVGYLFPYLMDIDHVFILLRNAGGCPNDGIRYVQYSPNSTNLQNGDWFAFPAITYGCAAVFPDYRTAIQTIDFTPHAPGGVAAIRWSLSVQGNSNSALYAVTHFYGVAHPGQVEDALRIWDPVSDVRLSGNGLNFDEISQGGRKVATCRVKNVSPTKSTTGGITVTDSMNRGETTPPTLPQFTFSTDNVTFSNPLALANLGPGAISPVIYVQDLRLANAVPGLTPLWVRAVPGGMA